jgi:hypothetical protein
MEDIITTKDKHGIKLEEYEGVYSLTACYNGYTQWGKQKVNKTDYSEKDRPIRVVLGDKDQAVKALLDIVNKIEEAPF